MEWLAVPTALLGVGAVYYLATRRNQRCPSCGRARVPGQGRCPFCQAPYGGQPTSFLALPREGARLVCIYGPYKGRTFPITGNQFAIGRSRENDLVDEGILVSRRHAMISFEQGQYLLFDRDSQIGPSVYLFEAGAVVPSGPIVATPEPIRAAPPAVPERVYQLRDYQIVQTLGGGGAATVYKALSRDGATVAIKIFHSSDPYLLQKFEQEGRQGQYLQHPHIVRIHDYGNQDGKYYIIMEYVDQGSLRKRLSPGHPMPLPDAITIVGQICEALSYAHSNQVIHRDIKPENILLSSTEGVKLVDFGIAKWTSAPRHTQDGIILGTPYYMSYEQAKGQPVYPSSDLYSVGVVLYEMVTGNVPFAGDALTVVEKHIKEQPVPPRRINPAVPPHIERAILRAMDKDYRRRFQSAAEFARALGYTPGPLGLQPALRPAGVVSSPRPQPASPGPGRPASVSPRPMAGARLVGPNGLIVPLAGDVQLGRGVINPNDGLISRSHACISQQGGRFWLRDLDSRNGTYLNGQRIFDPVLLQNGDAIRMGQTILRFEYPIR